MVLQIDRMILTDATIDHEARSQDGQRLCSQGRPAESELLQRAAIMAHPEAAHFHFRLGEALEAQGRLDEARDSYFSAAALASNVPLFRQRAAASALAVEDPETALARYEALPQYSTRPDAADSFLAVRLVAAGRMDLCRGPLKQVFGRQVRHMLMAEEDFGPHGVRIRFDGDVRDILFSRSFVLWPFMIDRLVAFASYLDRIDANGEVLFSLGDGPQGDARQLCFSSSNPDHLLVPDPIFLATGAYQAFRDYHDANAQPWRSRRPLGYWRGGLTGQADGLKATMGLPRIGLCLRARHSALIDAQITDIAQFSTLQPALGQALDGLSVLGEREAPERNFEYQFLIDVDGNTNAWQSLFMKFIAGGCVVKVRSPYRQWYYDSVQTSKTVIMVDSINDVADAVAWGLKKPALAEAIAKGGRKLAAGMSVQSEWPVFANAVSHCLASTAN